MENATNWESILGYQYVPKDNLNELKQLAHSNRDDVLWAVVSAYNLGRINGKREDRQRRASK